MKVVISTSDGGDLTVKSMPDEDIAQLLQEYDAGTPRLTFTLDDGIGASHIMSAHITRIDLYEEDA